MKKKLTLQPNSHTVAFKELFDEFIRFKKLQNLSSENIRYYEDYIFRIIIKHQRFVDSFQRISNCFEIVKML